MSSKTTRWERTKLQGASAHASAAGATSKSSRLQPAALVTRELHQAGSRWLRGLLHTCRKGPRTMRQGSMTAVRAASACLNRRAALPRRCDQRRGQRGGRGLQRQIQRRFDLKRVLQQRTSRTGRACRRLWTERALAGYAPAAGRTCARLTHGLKHAQEKRLRGEQKVGGHAATTLLSYPAAFHRSSAARKARAAGVAEAEVVFGCMEREEEDVVSATMKDMVLAALCAPPAP